MVERIPEHHDIAALDWLEAVNKLIDEDALLIGKERSHAGAFDFYRLVEENDNDQCEADSDQKVACPNANFVSQSVQRNAAGICRTSIRRIPSGICRYCS